jgi:fumarate reductase subunit D
MKRSNEPIFWSLFGAGGVVVAFILPMLIFITGVAVPLGILPAETLSFARIHGFAAGWPGKIFIFIVITLPLWHGVHRIFLSLHDLGIHRGRTLFRWGLYGLAFVCTIMVFSYLLII